MTSNKKLLIVDTNHDIKLNKYEENYDYYSLSSGLVEDFNAKSLNSSKYFHLTALRLKEKYLSFIQEFQKYFNQNKIGPYFNHFYWTDISCKRTEYLRNFDYICHIVILKKIVNENKYEEIILYNISPEIIYSLKGFINCKIKILKKYNSSKYQFIKTFIIQLNYFIKMITLKILLNIFYIPNKSVFNLNNLYFSTYPKNFKNNKHIKYGNFIQNDSGYIISFLTDNIHQKFNLFKLFLQLREIKNIFKNNNILITDYFINLSDLIYFIKINFFYFNFKNTKFINHKIEDIDFSKIVQKEINEKLFRLTRILTISNSYKRLSKLFNKKINFYYYLFEYPYGRMLSYSFSNSNIIKIGFQHGPVGHLKMICFLSDSESLYLKNYKMIPEKTYSEDLTSLKIYKKGNYQNIIKMNEVYRLSYLKSIIIKDSKIKIHLIACGLHDGLMLINLLKEKINKNNSVNYIVKLHPKGNNNEIIKFLKKINLTNLSIANKNIEYYFQYINKVYFSYTSIGDEAEILGIKTEVIFSYYKLNESKYCTEDRL